LERRTLAIFLRAELGFLGVAVLTAVQTPRFCGADCSTAFFLKELNVFWRAGAVDFFTDVWRPFLTNWLNVGIPFHLPIYFSIDFSMGPCGCYSCNYAQKN
jgi:hypothetical protein